LFAGKYIGAYAGGYDFDYRAKRIDTLSEKL